MANIIYIPFLNPSKFYDKNFTRPPQYELRHMDDYQFVDQLYWWQTNCSYKQKWTIHDSVPYQFTSDFPTIQADLIDCFGVSYQTVQATQVMQDKFNPGFFIYELAFSMASIDPGVYFPTFTFGGSDIYVCEPIQVAISWPDSVLLEYFNSSYYGDVFFESGIRFGFRINDCVLTDFDPANVRTSYKDERYNPVTLKSIPYRTWDFIIEKDFGGPDWVLEKLNWIFSCDNVFLDGKPVGVLDDSKFEANKPDPRYPMRSFSIKLQEGVNRASKLVNVTLNSSKRLALITPMDNTIFGYSGGSAVDIINVQSLD